MHAVVVGGVGVLGGLVGVTVTLGVGVLVTLGVGVDVFLGVGVGVTLPQVIVKVSEALTTPPFLA